MKRNIEKAIAWQRRSKPLRRVAMAPSKKRLNPVSKRRDAEIVEEAPIRRSYLAEHPICEMQRYCEAYWMGIYTQFNRPESLICTGIATDVHEPWTRARGGPTDDPRNMRALCRNCHHWITFTVGGQQWADAYGFLVSAEKGPKWLATRRQTPII